MDIYYDVGETEQLNNLEFCNNSSLIYSTPFAISLSIFPKIPQSINSDKELVGYIDRALAPVCEETSRVFSKIMVFIGKSKSRQCEPVEESTSSERLSIESGLGSQFQKAKGDSFGGSSTISTSNGLDVTIVIAQRESIQNLFKNQKDAGEYFKNKFCSLSNQGWDIQIRVGIISSEYD